MARMPVSGPSAEAGQIARSVRVAHVLDVARIADPGPGAVVGVGLLPLAQAAVLDQALEEDVLGVDVGVDQTGQDDAVGAIDHLGVRTPATAARSDMGDGVAGDDQLAVGDDVLAR